MLRPAAEGCCRSWVSCTTRAQRSRDPRYQTRCRKSSRARGHASRPIARGWAIREGPAFARAVDRFSWAPPATPLNRVTRSRCSRPACRCVPRHYAPHADTRNDVFLARARSPRPIRRLVMVGGALLPNTTRRREAGSFLALAKTLPATASRCSPPTVSADAAICSRHLDRSDAMGSALFRDGRDPDSNAARR